MKKNGDIIIRPAQPGEYGWIIQVHGQYYAEKHGWYDEFECIVAQVIVEYLSSEEPDKQACFIAEYKGNPVGCIILMKNNDIEGKLRVLFVSENVREKGIGCLLVKSLVEQARLLGYKRLSLWTSDNQKVARVLYEKVGFSLVSETPNTTFAKDSNDEYWEMEL
jgi:N-acetylglutamate synthase-like GNAT family acetyltransferase